MMPRATRATPTPSCTTSRAWTRAGRPASRVGASHWLAYASSRRHGPRPLLRERLSPLSPPFRVAYPGPLQTLAHGTTPRAVATSDADLFRFARINDPRTLLDLRPRDAVLARGEVMVAIAHAQLRLALRSALFRISRVSPCARDVVQVTASAARREQDHATPPSPCAATPGRQVPKRRPSRTYRAKTTTPAPARVHVARRCGADRY